MSARFNELEPAASDQIMVANAQWPTFRAEHPDGINTTIGVMVDPESTSPWQSETVRSARSYALSDVIEGGLFGYQSQSGYPDFIAAAGEQVFGAETYLDHAKDILGYQTVGGTNSLRLAKDVLEVLVKKDGLGAIPLVLDAGWPNHPAVFSEPFSIEAYQHMDPETGTYDHRAALEAFTDAPKNAVFLLQTCGYNDDGMDRTKEQWDEIIDIAEAKAATVLLDSAYMGLVNGFETEHYPILQSMERGLLTFVCFSASKNMGLYNERLGALYIANAKDNLGAAQLPNLKQLIDRSVRRSISSAPLVTAKAAAFALRQASYHQELEAARLRLKDNRDVFGSIVAEVAPEVRRGGGLFAKILANGFSVEQQKVLIDLGIHALPNSRINVGGIHADQVERVGLAVLRALKVS